MNRYDWTLIVAMQSATLGHVGTPFMKPFFFIGAIVLFLLYCISGVLEVIDKRRSR